MGAKAVSPIMATLQAVSAIAEQVALFNVVTYLAIPIAHFAIVFALGMLSQSGHRVFQSSWFWSFQTGVFPK